MTGGILKRFAQLGGALLGLLALSVAFGAVARSGSITAPQGENQRSFSSPEEARKALLGGRGYDDLEKDVAAAFRRKGIKIRFQES